MASESALIATLKRRANQLPCTRIKKLWSSHVNRDIDILVVTYGIACFFEIKLPGQKPTGWQYNQLAWWARSGAVTGWYDNVDACIACIYDVPRTFSVEENLLRGQHWARLALDTQ